MNQTLESLRQHKIVVIYRGQSPEDCLALTRRLYEAGLRLFEVTLNSDQPLASIRLLRKEFGSDVGIGAGTVLEPDEVSPVADAGASFVISPNLDERVVTRTKDAGLVSIPGTFTPSEIVRAVQVGADMVKVFPIRSVGADYIRQVRAPLPHIPIVATGGVNAALARECFAAGCVGVGVGVHLLASDPHQGSELAENAGELIAASRSAP